MIYSSIMVDLVGQLRDAARQSRLIMFALSKLSGVPYSAVHGFLTGDRRLSLRSAAKLATVLGLELCRTGRRKRKAGKE